MLIIVLFYFFIRWLHVCSLVKGGLFSEINSSENISDLRFTLQRGLEVIRGEGLPPLVIVSIARTFASRVSRYGYLISHNI